MHLDPLEVAGLWLVVDDQPVEELPFIAADALVRGIDSPLLREAASASPSDWFTARDRFIDALAELSFAVDLPEQDVLWQLTRHTASLIVAEEVSAHEGAPADLALVAFTTVRRNAP